MDHTAHLFLQDFLQYTNHVGLCTEEISEAGEAYVVLHLHTTMDPN